MKLSKEIKGVKMKKQWAVLVRSNVKVLKARKKTLILVCKFQKNDYLCVTISNSAN